MTPDPVPATKLPSCINQYNLFLQQKQFLALHLAAVWCASMHCVDN